MIQTSIQSIDERKLKYKKGKTHIEMSHILQCKISYISCKC